MTDEVHLVSQLHEILAAKVEEWVKAGYPAPDFPAITEILDYASEDGRLRFLRRPQLRAIQTYWYLRLVERTPHTLDLYKKLFNLPGRLKALGLVHPDITELILGSSENDLWQRVKTDDEFVKQYGLEALRESLLLEYPSYILALAMGAGKTILIASIIATEFAMALEYPGQDFVQNALVFAPGKTIIESLKEIASVPYDQVLPPRLYKPFSTSLKLTFTRDGEKDLPVVRGSLFNVIVTNSEKIRIQKPTVRAGKGWTQLQLQEKERQEEQIANLRLQAIASLPHLGVFSDEAHHTYGQAMGEELKKIRKTVDYLHANTKVICVVNTTGTPYYKRQLLKDVVVWYSLSEGIKDGYLKEVAGNIQAYDFSGEKTAEFVALIVKDFFGTYRDVALPNGAPAKLALYFPQQADLDEYRPIIEATLVELGLSPTICLRNTSASTAEEIDAFNRLNQPDSPYRVLLLVNKGTEGWNCHSLFACALVRKLQSSNNFVLQAATRCLRQVSGNKTKARIYLSMDNRGVLDQQLQETYGESLDDLNMATVNTRRTMIRLRKLDIPPVTLMRRVVKIVRKPDCDGGLTLTRPATHAPETIVKTNMNLQTQATSNSVLTTVDQETIEIAASALDVYAAATELAAVYRLNALSLCEELRRIYDGATEINQGDLVDLGRQIEAQIGKAETVEELREESLALIKTGEKDTGFEKHSDGGEVYYTAKISYPKDKEHLLLSWEKMKDFNPGDFGFHYTPYNFDSSPEMSFFWQFLSRLQVQPHEVEDVYFTGALDNPAQTDFFVEYEGEDHRWHNYTPDFLIRLKNGKYLIVEIKDVNRKSHPIDGEQGRKAMALRKWEKVDPAKFKYHMVFASTEAVGYQDVEAVWQMSGEAK